MGLLGSMQVNFIGNTSGLQGSVGQAKNILSQLTDNPVKAVGAGLLLAGAAAVAFTAKSVQMAGQYQQAMNMVKALTGSNTDQMAKYDTGVKQLAVDAGVAPTALASGLYNVLSASYRGADAMRVLTLATEDSKIGMTSASVTTDALTNVLRSFGVQSKDITRVNGEMLETVTLGKSTFEQYASVIVKSSSAAVQFHVSMETMNAAWSTMTSSGIRAAQASTDFQSSLKVMYGNIGTVTTSLHKNGIAFDEAKFNTMSYGDKVVYLNAALEQANAKHVKVTGVTLQAAQAISTISKHIGDYNNNLSTLSDKQAMADKTQQAWATTQGGFNQSMDRLKASLDVLMINIGSALLPILTNVVNSITPIITSIANWEAKTHGIENAIGELGDVLNKIGAFLKTIPPTFTSAWNTVQSTWGKVGTFFKGVWDTASGAFTSAKDKINGAINSIIGFYERWKTPILAVAGAITLFFLPAMIKAGVEAVISGAKITANFIKSMIQAGTEAAVNGAKTTAQFVQAMIKSGVEAVINGAKVTAQFVASMIKAGVEAVINGAKITAQFVASVVKAGVEGWTSAGKLLPFVGHLIASGVQAVIAGAKMAASFIANIVKSGVEAGIAGAKIAAQFVAAIVKSGVEAAIAAGKFVATLIPAIISFVAEALVAAATAIPAIITGFIAWAAGAWAVAAANIAAFWPIYLVIAVIIGIIALVVLAVKNWGAISAWLTEAWNKVRTFMVGLWNDLVAGVRAGIAWIGGAINAAAAFIYHWFIEPYLLIWAYIKIYWAELQVYIQAGIRKVQDIIHSAGNTLYSFFIQPFVNAYNFIKNLFGNLGHLIQNTLGGLGGTLHNLHIPGFAGGVNNLAQGTWAVVGEAGPELMYVPGGSSIYPSGTGPNGGNNSMRSVNSSGTSGNQTIIFQMDSRELARITGDRQARLVRLKMNRRAA